MQRTPEVLHSILGLGLQGGLLLAADLRARHMMNIGQQSSKSKRPTPDLGSRGSQPLGMCSLSVMMPCAGATTQMKQKSDPAPAHPQAAQQAVGAHEHQPDALGPANLLQLDRMLLHHLQHKCACINPRHARAHEQVHHHYTSICDPTGLG